MNNITSIPPTIDKSFLGFITKSVRNLHLVAFTTFYFLFLTVYLLFFSPYDKFYFDSHQYWNLAFDFNGPHGISLLNYTNPLRGVYFPLFNAFLIIFCRLFHIEYVIGFKVASAAIIAVGINLIIPLFLRKAFNISFSVWQLFALNLLVFIFWRDYFNFPLTDFPSLFILLVSLYFFLSDKPAYLLLSGLALAICISFRPVYVITVPIILCLVIYNCFTKKNAAKELTGGLLLIAGLLLGSFPQAYINYHNHNTISPLVQTDEHYQGESLYLKQLIWGISYEKYESNVGITYPKADVKFINKSGERLLSNNAIKSIPDYIQTVLSNPGLFVIIYGKHLFNGLDINYPTPYISDVYDYSLFLSLLNYSLVFLFIVIFIHGFRQFLKPSPLFFIYAIFIAQIVVLIPTAIETRFFLPLHLIIYLTVLLYDYRKMSFTTGKIIGITALYVLFIAACLVLSADTYSKLEYGPVTKGIPGISTR